ncbi:hypothetical protein A3A60_03555 [Candidatus Curtissbacteria bacterium RIFCSPLOWO2_01_FULL_42_26]|uniref:DUF6883 domain-containing protein n=1 Tax=Candidatus Curtissbacteria bacterium RIFCSPLOWO2_01_FULL_42_26 TaxID=1797729 RepID=A0A1F5I419_9BACT|nr:MAG: hypothetical protein A3A60_03555 [Candidatus Curtissbacteria bacterium RIFCSPLOWO2_01_FULL_42_26]
MKLPNRDKAIISTNKLVTYLLSETHPVGSTKARFFRGLGFNETNIDKLENALLKMVRSNNVNKERNFKFGTNYAINGAIETPSGKTVTITSVWFVKTVGSRPSFVTAYPV